MVLALLVAITLENFLGAALSSGRPAQPNVSISVSTYGNSSVTVSVHSRTSQLGLHVAVLPTDARSAPAATVLFLVDPHYPVQYTDFASVEFASTRTAQYLAQMGAPTRVVDVTGSDLAAALAANPRATLVDAGTALPDTVLSAESLQLVNWVKNGGTLVWAGGPLGYTSGHPLGGNAGFFFEDLKWAGQVLLAGYPVTDPGQVAPVGSVVPLPAPPVYGTNQSLYGAALGTDYIGTADGANVSRLSAHGGVALGTVAFSAGRPASARTSLAYLPVGRGAIELFGGADYSSYIGYAPFANGWIPYGSVLVSQDVAVLAGTGYVPGPALPLGKDVDVGAGATASLTFSVANYVGPVWVVVRSSTVGSYYLLWAREVNVGEPSLFGGVAPRPGISSGPSEERSAGATATERTVAAAFRVEGPEEADRTPRRGGGSGGAVRASGPPSPGDPSGRPGVL